MLSWYARPLCAYAYPPTHTSTDAGRICLHTQVLLLSVSACMCTSCEGACDTTIVYDLRVLTRTYVVPGIVHYRVRSDASVYPSASPQPAPTKPAKQIRRGTYSLVPTSRSLLHLTPSYLALDILDLTLPVRRSYGGTWRAFLLCSLASPSMCFPLSAMRRLVPSRYHTRNRIPERQKKQKTTLPTWYNVKARNHVPESIFFIIIFFACVRLCSACIVPGDARYWMLSC